MPDAIPEPLDTLPRIDLRIPGPWKSREEFQDALRADGEFAMVDGVLVQTATGLRYELNVSAADDQIAGLFADGKRIAPEQVRAIERHIVKVHVSGAGGSIEAAKAIMEAGAAVVRAGGLGVMVDNSAVCHPPTDWLELTDGRDDGGIYWAYVMLTHHGRDVYSTGMHCLGYREAEMPDAPDLEFAAFFIHNFLGYCYQSGRTVIDGDSLNDLDGPMYTAHHHPCVRYPAGSSFHNPYGVWVLIKAEREDEEGDDEGDATE